MIGARSQIQGIVRLSRNNRFAPGAIAFPLAASNTSLGAVQGVRPTTSGAVSIKGGTFGKAFSTTAAAADFIKLGAIPQMTTTSFTALVIVKLADLSANPTIFESGSTLGGLGTSNNSFQFRANSNGSLGAVKDNIADLGSSPGGIVSAGKYFVAAVSYGSGVMRIAADGKSVYEVGSNETFLSGNFSLLSKDGTAAEKSAGDVALFVYWPRLMTQAEMAEITARPMQVFEDTANDDDELFAAAAGVNVTAAIAWTEGDETTALAGLVTNRASISWTESGDTIASVGVVSNRAAIGWTEQGDTVSLIGAAQSPAASNYTAAISWTEASETMSIGASLLNRASIVISEQNETWAMTGVSALPPGSPYPQLNIYTIMRDTSINVRAPLGVSINLTGKLL